MKFPQSTMRRVVLSTVLFGVSGFASFAQAAKTRKWPYLWGSESDSAILPLSGTYGQVLANYRADSVSGATAMTSLSIKISAAFRLP
jgi:hypothetical protein